MCQRFAYTLPPTAMDELFDVSVTINLQPRWNIAPTQPVSVIVPTRDGGRRHARLRWGLVPAWARDAGAAARSTNARAETIAQKPTFRDAFRRRRCLVPADAYYEWADAGGYKQPFRFSLPGGQAFAFAGLYEAWRGPDGQDLATCAIVTVAANADVESLHHRMPAILPPEHYASWLAEPRADLLQPWAGSRLEVTAVDRRLGNVRNDDAACAAPVPLPAAFRREAVGEDATGIVRRAERPVQGELF